MKTLNTNDYTDAEISIIINKMDNLGINYTIKSDSIIILDDIGQKIYQYLLDFTKE